MGLVFVLLTGLIWGGIGVVLAIAAKRKLDVLVFIAVATGISCIGAWAFIADWPVLLAGDVERPIQLTILLIVAGTTGVIGMLSLQKAMSVGAAAWTVGQSALVIPFLAGMLFLGDPFRLPGVIGVAVVLASLLFFYKAEKASAEGKGPWFRFALMAFVFLGIQQTLSSIPSSWGAWSDTARLRVPLVLLAGAVPLLVIVAVRKKSVSRSIWGLAFCYAALVVLGQVLLFRSLDQLRAENRLSLAFPLALGTCIVIVALWDIIACRRRPSKMVLAGMLLGTGGVVLLAI